MRICLAIAVTALACGTAPSNGPDAARAESPAAASPVSLQSPPGCGSAGLELQLMPSRREITLGEPAVVFVRLRNCSSAVAEVPEDLALEPDRAALQLTIAPPQAEPFRYLPPVRSRTRPRTTLLEPGAVRGEVAHVYVGQAHAWLIGTPGVHRFRARLTAAKGAVDSAPAEMNVRPAPAGATHEVLASAWRALGRALYAGEASATRGARAALDAHPPLRYLDPFVRVAEVMVRSEQQYDARTNQFVRPKCTDLFADAGRIVRAVPDPYFSAVAASRLTRCLEAAGDGAAARQLTEQVRAAHPDFASHPAMADLLGDARPSRR